MLTQETEQSGICKEDFDFRLSPFRRTKEDKDVWLTRQLTWLTEYHWEHCGAYARMLDAIGFAVKDCGVTDFNFAENGVKGFDVIDDFAADLNSIEFDGARLKHGSGLSFLPNRVRHYSELPFLPAGLYKRLRLSSLPEGEGGAKTITSSGTSAQAKSQIVLDGETRTLQQQALACIGADFFGKQRLPLLIIDCASMATGRNGFTARTAGILGFSLFGRHRTFAMREDMTLDMEILNDFLEKYGGKPFLIFGFTYLVWQNFCLEMEKNHLHPDLSNGILVHGGGWKRLQAQAVSKVEFKERLKNACGLCRVHDYYGMAEQAGSIFMECECGHLHASDFSGILFRRASDFSLCEPGETGIIQVLSVLPRSYPGHSILTEDAGRLLGVDDCPCGRKGAYFEVFGRLKNAEIRGCSDTMT